MADTGLKAKRLVSIVAATMVALACGTNVWFYGKEILFSGRLLNCETVCILGLVASVRREDEAFIYPNQPHSKPMTSPLDGPP